MTRQRPIAKTLTVLVAAMIALTGCGAGSSSGGSSAGKISNSSKTALETAYKGVTGTVPTVATTPKPGVSLWVISCGDQSPGCKTPAAEAKAAGEAAGWKVNACDGQLNPDGWGTCVRRATAAKADVIIPIGIDCASIQQPFEEAKAAGVKVVGGGGSDCDVTGGSKLWATERIELPDYTLKQWFELVGKISADYLIGKTNGKAKVLAVQFTDPVWGPWLQGGFTKELATCSGCTLLDTLKLANNDFVSNVAVGKFSNAIQKNATADAVFVPIGGWMAIGFAQAVKASGRNDSMTVTAGIGNEANYGLIKSNGGQDGALGYATAWGAWGSVDTAIRVMNGEQPVPEGDGVQIVDKDHNLPKSGDYDGGVDFRAAYKKIWGVS